jgi:hypothetical protein
MGRYQARLADRILHDLQVAKHDGSGDVIRREVISSPRFIIDHIAEDVIGRKDIHTYPGMFIAMPFRTLWCEAWYPKGCGADGEASGWFVSETDSYNLSQVKLTVRCDLFSQCVRHYCIIRIDWSPRGTLFGDRGPRWIVVGQQYFGVTQEMTLVYQRAIPICPGVSGDKVLSGDVLVMYAMALLGCKGVTVANVSQPGGRPPVGRMKGKELTYKTLLIGGRKSHRESVSLGEIQGIIRAHMRRGNIAHYSEERPHVSGFVGPMWRSACVVGDAKNGKVVKDYEIRP